MLLKNLKALMEQKLITKAKKQKNIIVWNFLQRH
jgi:hypothetical protein